RRRRGRRSAARRSRRPGRRAPVPRPREVRAPALDDAQGSARRRRTGGVDLVNEASPLSLWTRVGVRAPWTRAAAPIWLAGLALAMLVALVALVLANLEERALGQPLIEALVLSLLLGVLLRNVLPGATVATLSPGTGLAAKQVLEVGVVLLAAGVYAPALLAAGPALL